MRLMLAGHAAIEPGSSRLAIRGWDTAWLDGAAVGLVPAKIFAGKLLTFTISLEHCWVVSRRLVRSLEGLL